MVQCQLCPLLGAAFFALAAVAAVSDAASVNQAGSVVASVNHKTGSYTLSMDGTPWFESG